MPKRTQGASNIVYYKNSGCKIHAKKNYALKLMAAGIGW